ncbi:hypothetical protein BGZ54_004645, partial [Gamsiella multidivaricata]
MNTTSPYGFLPYTPTSQVTSPGVQAHQLQQQQQPLSSPQQQQQQQQQQHPLGPVTSQQLSQELAHELSSPSSLSLHPTLQTSSASVSGSPVSPISVSGTLSSTGSNLSNHGHPTINTAMLSTYSNMLPSPQQSSQVPSTPTGTSLLPTTPPQTADLDTILATYANQPELLKLIIASKTEEDRRWAEEARFKMMDLIMRENRGMGLMTGYESLLSQAVPGAPGTATGTPVSSISTGNIGNNPGTNTTTATTTAATNALGLTPSGKRFMDDGFDTYSGAGGGGVNGNGEIGSFGQGPDHGLARKRSVTFARDVHHGHLRSQSMSSMPSATTITSSAGSSADQFSPLSLMGLTGPNTTLQSQQGQQQ